MYDFLKLPHKCPAGGYCPAGTALQHINDTINNAPQSCIEGYYCPEGSQKPTQRTCPIHATSGLRSKSWTDCYCENGYFGIAVNNYKCIKCFINGICIHNTTKNNLVSYMRIPEGYWPNYPENITNILACQNSTNFKTPCLESKCQLICQNISSKIINTELTLINCFIKCTSNCKIGHEGRLCSKCVYGYFLKNTGYCVKCSFGKNETVYLILPMIVFLSIFAYFVIRKAKKYKNIKSIFIYNFKIIRQY